MKKIILSLMVVLGLNISANAATYNFTGTVDILTPGMASFFGVTPLSAPTITATLDFDDTQSQTDAIENVSTIATDRSHYGYNSLNVSLGNKSWSYGAGNNENYVQVANAKNMLTIDTIAVNNGEDKIFTDGTIQNLSLRRFDFDHNVFNDSNASTFNLFNILTASGGFININIDGIFHSAAIRQLTMTQVSAVPLPAGVWLLGSAILGFMGLRRRKTSL